LLDTFGVIPDLSETEEAEYQRLVAEAKLAAQSESETCREDYISRSAAELVKTRGVSLEEARQAVVSRASGRLLPADTIVFAVQGEVSVADVLATPDKYDGSACADPVEGPAYGCTTAKFYANTDTDTAVVNSFAHGGRKYHLRDPAADFDDAAGQGGTIPDWVAVENSRACHGLYGHQDVVFELVDSEQGFRVTKAEGYKRYHKKMTTVTVNGKERCCVDQWLQHPDRTRAGKGLTMRDGVPPGITEDGHFNVWFGLINAIQGDWSKLMAHMLSVICGGDPIGFEYLLNWIAWAVQNPTQPIGVCLVLQGGQGTGKSVLGRAIRSIFGKHGVYMSNAKHLVGDFNSQLRGAAFVEADEAIYAGDQRQAAKLKSLITEPTIMIEEKGLPPINLDNMLKIFMATNETRAVNIGHDDRRFVVFDVSDERKGDYEYFALIYAEIEAGGPAAMLYDLLQRDISCFNPERDRPATEDHATQKRLSLPPLEAWWADRLEEGNLPHPNRSGCLLDGVTLGGESDFDAWTRGPVEASTQRLSESANDWIKERYPRAHQRRNAYDMRKMLEPYLDPHSPSYAAGKKGKLNGDRVRYITLRPHRECLATRSELVPPDAARTCLEKLINRCPQPISCTGRFLVSHWIAAVPHDVFSLLR